MGAIKISEDFDDRQLHLEAEAQQYIPYDYQTENNDSWAGALPVKQSVLPPLARRRYALR
jgi:glutamate synthase (NADPH/NADH)